VIARVEAARESEQPDSSGIRTDYRKLDFLSGAKDCRTFLRDAMAGQEVKYLARI
jgi:hypothetical protein